LLLETKTYKKTSSFQGLDPAQHWPVS